MADRLMTYAERELLLNTLNMLLVNPHEDDSTIIEAINEWTRQLNPQFGFEHALAHDIALLLKHLTDPNCPTELTALSRAALLYVLQPSRTREAHLGQLNHLDDAFICNYAVHEVLTQLDEPATYNPPQLTDIEKKQAEDMFLGFLENPDVDYSLLISRTMEVTEKLKCFSVSGLFERFLKNIEFLISVLSSDSWNDEEKGYAQAALAYLVVEKDTIDDLLGLVGYLDDNFIVQLAVDLINPLRQPWAELLDDVVAKWPFLPSVAFDEGFGGYPVSEYMMINSALMKKELHDNNCPSSILVVSPQVGPTAFVVGVISALGLIQEAEQIDSIEESYFVGQKVLVDNSAVAEFAGFDVKNGQEVFGLTKHTIQHGHRLPCTTYWPMSYLSRLVACDNERATRGKLVFDLGKSEVPIPALDYLFSSSKPFRTSNIEKRIVVVMPVSKADYLAKELKLYGYSLKDVLPMGHYTLNAEVRQWSSRFGDQEPLLIFVPDLDIACAYIEEHPEHQYMVIADASGKNANKTASMRRLRLIKVPSLIMAAERAVDELGITGDDDFAIWEWTSDDLSSLLWPKQVQPSSGLLADYERRLSSRSQFSITIEAATSQLADEAFAAVSELESRKKTRQDDQLIELDDLISVSFHIVTLLLRLSVPVDERCTSRQKIEDDLRHMKEILEASRFLSDEERAIANKARTALTEFYTELQCENPKAILLKALVEDNPSATIICPDARLRNDLENEYSKRGIRVFAACGDSVGDLPGAIIPGWFRKKRMAELLEPPIANPTYLILYGIEQKWYGQFALSRKKAYNTRLANAGRAKLFPVMEKWRNHEIEIHRALEAEKHLDLDSFESISSDVNTTYRQSVYKSARSDGSEIEIPAHLVLFEGNLYGFLTEFYKANVVTHLIDSVIEQEDESADVRQVGLEDLTPGDALLFHRGSAKDVIRSAADTLLEPGVRSKASLWRDALLLYVSDNGLSTAELWSRLKEAGCPLTQNTIRIWLEDDNMIAPRNERDIRIIAGVTNDETFSGNIDEVSGAIREVRSAHIRASHQLAKRVMANAISILKEEGEQTQLVEIEPNVVVARILEIDNQSMLVRMSLTNRLLEAEQWHE